MSVETDRQFRFPRGCRAAGVALALCIAPPVAMAATADITQAGTGAQVTGTASSPAGGMSRARSRTRSITTPHMTKSMTISHVMTKTAGGPGGVHVGHAMVHARSKSLDTPGHVAVTASVSTTARTGGARHAQGSVTVGAAGTAQATAPGRSAQADGSASASSGTAHEAR